MAAKQLTDSLENWPALNLALVKATEEECKKLMAAERKGRNRLDYLLRIQGRYNRVRNQRERYELMTGAAK